MDKGAEEGGRTDSFWEIGDVPKQMRGAKNLKIFLGWVKIEALEFLSQVTREKSKKGSRLQCEEPKALSAPGSIHLYTSDW